MFKRVLVANRGEIACRVIRALREMGVESVAIYSKADETSLHVRDADRAVCVGEGANSDSYLNLANVLMACEISGAEAVHPGYGYFSERPRFAEALASIGVKFIGPPVAAIEAMGDKAAAKRAAADAGCPILPGSEGVVGSESAAHEAAAAVGYPVLLKAVAGGGGRGIRRVDSADELTKAFPTAGAEALASFGSGELIVEKCVLDPRHVEVQVLADEHGSAVHLGERECSIQNTRHQKIIEEAPFAGLPEATRRQMGEAAVRVALAVGYANAGTVEFLADRDGEFYFLEMNTRLQVEHPVTEQVTGIDLVKQQLRIAAGQRLDLKQSDVRLTGHAIEARITAQDSERDFAPGAGAITAWRQPGFRNVRVDTYVAAGVAVPPFYDPLIAKLIVTGQERQDAVRLLEAALMEFHVEGVPTSIPFLLRIVRHPDFVSGEVSTSFVRRLLERDAAA